MKTIVSSSKFKKRSARRVLSVQDAQFNQLAQQLGVTLKELAPLLQISESTLHRYRKQAHLKGTTAERVELLQGTSNMVCGFMTETWRLCKDGCAIRLENWTEKRRSKA